MFDNNGSFLLALFEFFLFFAWFMCLWWILGRHLPQQGHRRRSEDPLGAVRDRHSVAGHLGLRDRPWAAACRSVNWNR